jgi:polyphosphate kinase
MPRLRSKLPPASRRTPAASAPSKLPYFNRELSWLAFNRRVLDFARAPAMPLLEKLKFLAIVSSNLDEFFQIRVAGLIQQVDSGVEETAYDGLSPRELLRRIHSVVASLVDDQYRCWNQDVVPALKAEGILFKHAAELSRRELRWAQEYFEREVFPALTPLSIDPAHPFPQIGNKTLNLVVSIDYPDTPGREAHLAIIPLPRVLPRVVPIGINRPGETGLIFLGEIIKLFVGRLFPGCHVNSAKLFRITRNSDLYIDEEEAENLLKKIEAELKNLRRGSAVRVEVEEGVDEHLFKTLLDHVDLPNEYVFHIDGPVNLTRLMSVYETIDRPDLKFSNFTPARPVESTPGSETFARVAAGDLLLHHPYEAFDPVVDFVRSAARDPQVCAIKQTLYRTSGDSPIVAALIEAAQHGKQVTALVELKARFDEANNIQWARQLEEAGAQVVYGMVGVKVHAKLCLVVRKESKALRHYAHLGTGNYNPRTARLYTDFSLFTARPEITREVAFVFNTVTGFGRPHEFQHLLVAPFNLHENIVRFISSERRHALAGKPARIIAQVNSLVDKKVIDALYAASRAGVSIDLIVRGVCCLVPGVKGLSENIRVRSIVGQFLEHARVCYFANAGRPRVYLGSADWMPRNFYRRVEVLFPIVDAQIRQRLLEQYLPTMLADNVGARELQPTGAYLHVAQSNGTRQREAQREFLR